MKLEISDERLHVLSLRWAYSLLQVVMVVVAMATMVVMAVVAMETKAGTRVVAMETMVTVTKVTNKS